MTNGPEAAGQAPAAGGMASATFGPLAVPPSLAATLVFLRHGQSEWLAEGRFQGRSDTPLTSLGRRQAALAGARLAAPDAPPRLPVPAGEPLAVVHSPLARTRETAEAVAAAFATAGSTAGSPARPAKRAKRVIPIIGVISTTRSARGSFGSSIASSEYFMASAPPFENPTRCTGPGAGTRRRASRTASRVAAIQSSQRTSVRPAGTVPCPGRRTPIATKPRSR